jgi:hypothetical protein
VPGREAAFDVTDCTELGTPRIAKSGVALARQHATRRARAGSRSGDEVAQHATIGPWPYVTIASL